MNNLRKYYSNADNSITNLSNINNDTNKREKVNRQYFNECIDAGFTYIVENK